MTEFNVMPSDLFPLRLSDFEYYMFRDDRPSHPMVFLMLVEVTGVLRESAFRESVRELLTSQPLLACNIVNIRGDWFWMPTSNPSEQDLIDWQDVSSDSAARFTPAVRRIDIGTSHGIHLEVRSAPDRSVMAMHVHHACCDGIGAIQLIGELFARPAPARAAGSTTSAWRPRPWR